MDLAGLNFEKNQMLLWHCGIGSVDLQPETGVSIIPHPMLDRRNPEREYMSQGVEHHLIVVPGNIEEALHECAVLSGIAWMNMETYSNGL